MFLPIVRLETPMIELEGKYTDAQILGVEEVEEQSLAQVQKLIDHEAFTEPVRLMPDIHPGKGSVIGFTMPLGDRIIPNLIGVDIGCGMQATNVGPEILLEDMRQKSWSAESRLSFRA